MVHVVGALTERMGGAGGPGHQYFYIGAHAAVRGMRLLTCDGSRYRTYFPALHVVAPGISG